MLREARWTDRILLTLRRRRAVIVSGDSMRPSLNDQDVVIIEPSSAIVVGDIVLADHPFKNGVSILKRVVAIDDSGRFDLRGDNPNESSDSRSFGTVPALSIRGKAVCRLKSGS